LGNVNLSFIITLCIILLGYFGKKSGLLKESDGEGISRIVFNITLPATVINTFSTLKVDFSLLSMPLISALYGLLMTGFALFAFRKYERKRKGLLSIMVPAFNIGLFAYPLVEAIWGKEGLKYFGMFDMGNALIVFGVSYIVASIYSSESSQVNYLGVAKKVFSSIPLLAYIVTLILNISGLKFPSIFLDMAGIISRANMALSLLLLGIYLNFSFEKVYWKKMAQILLMRYIPGILIGVILYMTLPLPPMYRITLLLGLNLPISLAIIPYSVQFDYDSKFAGTASNITIIFSFLLIWLTVSLIHV
jgi:malate permease and related proteins